MRFDPQPHALIGTDGRPHLGLFADSITHINGRDGDYRTAMGKPASRRARHFHYKQFQYFGVLSDELLIGCALADTAYLGIAFFYLYDTATATLTEFTWRAPLSRALTMSDSPVAGESRFTRGQVALRMGYHQDAQGQRHKSLDVDLPGVRLNAMLHEPPGYQPMSICTRTGINGWTYANKVAGVAISGELHTAGRRWDLARLAGAGGHHDFSAGYMRRETFWNWACFSGRVNERYLGLNLSCGVNETSVNENCLWLDNRLIKIDGTRFDYDPDNLERPWRITSRCGQIALTFTPQGKHRERLNLGLFASNFQQLFGRFQGEIRLQGEAPIPVHDLHGFVEEQYAKW